MHGNPAFNRVCEGHFGEVRLSPAAVLLAFQHPYTNDRVDITAPLPPHMKAAYAALTWPVHSQPTTGSEQP